MFGQEGGCNKTFFYFINLCLQNMKSYRFVWGPFLGNFWVDVQKHYIYKQVFQHICNSKKSKTWSFSNVTNWAKLMVTNRAKLVSKNKSQLGRAL